MIGDGNRGAVIADARVFQEDWVPGDMRHRDAELNLMASALEPVVAGEPGNELLLTGPSGTGKTCSAKFLLGKLRERVLDVDTQYVNCWSDYTRYRVLFRILDGIDSAEAIRNHSSASDLLERLRATDTPVVVILDEVDQLAEPTVLYDLYELPHVEMILIANGEAEVLAGIDDRLHSRLRTATRVSFDRYGTDALVSILDQRVQTGLQPGVVGRSELESIARAANGNARDAIAVLRSAAQLAESRDEEAITDAVVDDAVSDARTRVRRTLLEKLNDHQRVLYDLIAAEEPIGPGTLYEAYERAVEEPRTKRTLRSYLKKMEQYSLVVAEGAAQGRQYRTGDPGPDDRS
ncbi:Cdc6/Cdc18 family protein [Halanaeroarchaeum sulfurireducens]|uniref:Orc1/cdc6 family replication initiation protein n=1 Tax=Halanaeroarchaeum sulfurireducens TaxID=1604004 RepID=A0A0F7PBV8_9EURY|nr:Cdc6/Cdc18 family protein [Halanaeroarchaeum sulfurireducens]AKH96833.1 orc1/cdc6 family replication initiation protein [Halanaeroarchaeum sulfurireducens]ALG81235.1 orc1/cdc6 family replication initiation protein [Halanaeroarchaeum sulfurireducens]